MRAESGKGNDKGQKQTNKKLKKKGNKLMSFQGQSF